MGRTQRSTRKGAERLSWQQRHTISNEPERLMAEHARLREQIRAENWIL